MEEPKALRFNEGKPQLHYILYYPRFLEALAWVQERGEDKYGYGNWMFGGKPDREYYDSNLRHLGDHFNGDIYDNDSGASVLIQAIWNLMNLFEQNTDFPVSDPDFDLEAYQEKWKDYPKQETTRLSIRDLSAEEQ